VTGEPWRERLVEGVQAAEELLLHTLHAAGLAPDVHGQPGWPFAHRIAVETLAIDGGLARQCALALGCAALAVPMLALGLAWARGRWPVIGLALALLAFAPWPDARIVLAPASPTSFHRAPGGFSASAIAHGAAVYGRACAACHGARGDGEGPRAAGLSTWPPRLDGALLWRRLDGEVFWRIAHGMPAMPASAGRLSDDDVWSTIAAMKALAAGEGVRAEGAWVEPVRVPDALVACDDGRAPRALSSLRGAVRIVADAPGRPGPAEDPRFLTIHLGSPRPGPAAGCRVGDPAAWDAFARVSGLEPAALAGAQWLVDRRGWLRALARPGSAGWSRDDLLCRAAAPFAPPAPRAGDALDDLLAAIDATPIRDPAFGPAHPT